MAHLTAPERLPIRRPSGLELSEITARWWRIDATGPAEWRWDPFGRPRFRFDSADGLRRVRYASSTARGAARERYLETRTVPSGHAHHHLVEIAGTFRVLDLRLEAVTDAIGVDDEICVGTASRVYATCRTLSDRVVEWWGTDVHGLVYRSRKAPESATHLAFFESAAVTVVDAGPLELQLDLLTALVLGAGFAVEFPLRYPGAR